MNLEKQKLSFAKALELELDGRTGKWLSDKTGLSTPVMSLLVSGRLKPSIKQLATIKAVFPNLNFEL